MGAERRSVPRVELPQEVKAKVKSALPARILDISSQGAQLEVTAMLCPNTSLDLRIALDAGDIAFRAVVRRCKVWGFGLDEKSRKVLVYRAGVEFMDVAPEVMALLTSNFLFHEKPSEEEIEDEAIDQAIDKLLLDTGGEAHRAPSSRGPVKIRVHTDTIQASRPRRRARRT